MASAAWRSNCATPEARCLEGTQLNRTARSLNYQKVGPSVVSTGEDDVRRAKDMFGCEDGVIPYIVKIGTRIKSATKAEADAMHAEASGGSYDRDNSAKA